MGVRFFMPGLSRRPGPRNRDTRTGGSRGQSVVEFALVLPLMVILLLAIVDLARIYTTMLSVESAAREAADFGTTLGAEKWQVGGQMDATVAEMERRACIASSNLPDYVGPDTACDNPDFEFCMTPAAGGICGPVDPRDRCDSSTRSEPCTVTVTLTHDFLLLAPLSIEFFGVRFGLPSKLTFQRDSTFAMTDIDLAPAPGS